MKDDGSIDNHVRFVLASTRSRETLSAGGSMNFSIEQMRQRGREIEENNRRLHDDARQRTERVQDRSDAERRHKESLAARSSSGPQITIPTLSFRASLKLIVAAGILYGAAFTWSAVSPSKQSAGQVKIAAEADTISEVNDVRNASNIQAAADGFQDENPPSPGASIPDNPLLPAAAELRGAILGALDSGSTVTWQVRDQSGFITVSEPVQVTGEVCRTIEVSSSEGSVRKIGTTTWCRGDGNSWTEH